MPKYPPPPKGMSNNSWEYAAYLERMNEEEGLGLKAREIDAWVMRYFTGRSNKSETSRVRQATYRKKRKQKKRR